MCCGTHVKNLSDLQVRIHNYDIIQIYRNTFVRTYIAVMVEVKLSL